MTRQALDELQNEYDAFVYAVSHDFGAPLRSLVGFSELINERYHEQLDTAGKEYLGFLFSGGRKSQVMLEALLTLSRLRVQSESCEWLDTDSLVREVVNGLDKPDGIEPSFRWTKLPQIWGSRVHLVRVFEELLKNALDYRDPERQLLVEIQVTKQTGGFEVRVRDNGIGMAQNQLPHIFDPFSQVHSRESHAGMGLTYCRKAVREHGGSLGVESVEGQGTVFTFTLPCGGRKTEPVKAKKASSAETLSFLQNHQEGVFFLDDKHTIRFANPAAAGLLGKAPGQIEGEPFPFPISEEFNEVEIVRPDGSPGVATVRVQNSSWDTGGTLMITMTDVTEEREQERQDRQSDKMEAVGRLAGGIAHDFNNVLAAIQSYSTLLRDAPATEQAGILAQIEETLEQGRGLTHRLLTFSERSRPSVSSIDVNSVLNEMTALLNKTLGPGIELEFDLVRGVAPALADRSDLAQILLNLLVNARDAMADGGKVTVSTSKLSLASAETQWGLTTPAGNYLSIRVEDQGRGIDPEVLPKVFDPFFSTKKDALNSGLGLSIVYNTLRQHHGGLRVLTSPEGSCFEALLPWGNLVAQEPLSAVLPSNKSADSQRLRILLVDDDRHVRDATKRLLGKLGHLVTTASSGQEALQLSQEADWELLMTDVAMPGMNGFQLWSKFRKLKPNAEVVFVSGYSSSSLAGHEEMQGSHFLAKPYNARELKALLTKIALEQGRKVTP